MCAGVGDMGRKGARGIERGGRGRDVVEGDGGGWGVLGGRVGGVLRCRGVGIGGIRGALGVWIGVGRDMRGRREMGKGGRGNRGRGDGWRRLLHALLRGERRELGVGRRVVFGGII